MPEIVGMVASTLDSPHSPLPPVHFQRGCETVCPNLRRRPCLTRPLPLQFGPGRRSSPWAATRGRPVIQTSSIGAVNSGGDAQSDRERSDYRRERLLEFVANVSPDIVLEFAKSAPREVIESMQKAASFKVGTLPSEVFDVTISTSRGKFMQLMFSYLMLGYLFRNAQCHVELHRDMMLLPEDECDGCKTMAHVYTPIAEKSNVQGKVIRWNKETGAEVLDAREYMIQLEIEKRNECWRSKVAAAEIGRKCLWTYILLMDPITRKELGGNASEDVLLAMTEFMRVLMGDVGDSTEVCTSTANDGAKLCFWLTVVGYKLRTLEAYLDMGIAQAMPDP